MEEVKTNSLNNCRHCGGRAEAFRYHGGASLIRCTRCGIQTPILPWEEAVKRWNRDPKALG